MSFDLPRLPNGWEYAALDSCCQRGSITYGIVQPGSPVSEGVPIVRVNNFRDNHLDLRDVMRVAPEVESKYLRTRLKGGEVLLTIVGSVGQVTVAPASIAGFNVARAVAVIEPLSHVSADWIALCLRSPLSQHLLGSRANTTVQTTINLKDLRALPIPLPPAKERSMITALVGVLDDRITLLRETNATLEAIAQALFKSWFVDFDPVRAKMAGRAPEGMDEATAALFPDAMEETELGLVPKGWSQRPVYETAEFINGAAYKAFNPNAERQGLPIIKIAELKAGVTSQTAYSDVEMPSKYLIETADILFSWSGNPDTSIDTFVWAHAPAWLNQHIFRVIPQQKSERAYLLQMLRHFKPVFAELARNKQTTGLGHVTVADLKRLTFVWPGGDAIRAFDEVGGRIQQRIHTNDKQAISLAAVRDSLLPRLISGQLRLPDAQAQLEGALA